MGTSLTGLTPATTYDALIKVGDNGPLSATAKVLSDGLGNDSILALSTSGVGIGETSPTATLNIKSTSSNNSDNLAQVLTNSEFRLQYRADDISSLYIGGLGSERGFLQGVNGTQNAGADISLNPYGGNVGIGTSTPVAKLEVLDGDIKVTTQNTFAGFVTSRNTIPSSQGTQLGRLQYSAYRTGTTYVDGAAIQAFATEAWSASSTPTWLSFQTVASGSTSLVERVRIDSDGLKFNGDTAAANALDDYEEGTWTMGIAFDGASVGVTTSSNTGTYTKIGRQVTVNGYLQLTSKGSSTGSATITGLPFTIANNNANYSTAALWFNQITYDDQIFSVAQINTTTIALQESSNAGLNAPITNADFADGSGIIVNLTYFV